MTTNRSPEELAMRDAVEAREPTGAPLPLTRPANQGSAEFSACGRHRRRLDRWWSDGPRALVIGANPSSAGADKNDPTVFRLLDLLSWRPGLGGFTLMNAEDYIATDPADLIRWRDGLDLETLRDLRRANLDRIVTLAYAAPVRIAAWGALVMPGIHRLRLIGALSICETRPIHAFGLTNGGDPKHPLARGHHRIPNDAPLIMWRDALVLADGAAA